MKKITFEEIVQRVIKLESLFARHKIDEEEQELLYRVLELDQKHHGWVGDWRTASLDRSEFKDAAETVKLIRDWDKEHNAKAR